MSKSSHLQKPTKIPVSAWDIFKKLVSYLVRSAQSASRGACLSWLSGKLQLCSSITQTRSSILSHKLPDTGGSSVLWGGSLLFFSSSVPPFLAPSAGAAGWECPGTALWVFQSRMELPWDQSRGRAGASSGAWGWAVVLLPRSSASADGHPSLAAQTPQSIMIAEGISFIPGQGGRCCGCAGFQSPDSRIPPYKRSSWDLLLGWRSMELAPWNQGKLLQAACKISFGAD